MPGVALAVTDKVCLPPRRRFLAFGCLLILGATAAALLIVIESCLETLPALLVALTVKVNVPAAVGLPVIVPLLASVKPFGKLPLTLVHVIGVVPVAARVRLYAVPVVPFGRDAVVMAGAVAVGLLTVKLAVNVLMLPVPVPVTVTVAVYVPAVSPALGRTVNTFS